MNELLSAVFDMSLTASWVILAVLVVRFLLRKAPRKYSYTLWSVVAFRLCCPVSFSSVLSLFSLPLPAPAVLRQSETVTQITHDPVQVIIPATPATPTVPTSPVLPQLPVTAPTAPTVTTPAVTSTAVTAEQWLTAAAILWCIGMAALLLYAAASYIRLRRQLATAILLEGNVYQAENIRSPFILGFLRPKIYIPYRLEADALAHVLAHERTHLRRLDYIVKPLAFLLLTVHCFNPLVWLAFFLMSRDMEMSCDEAVLAEADNIRKAYSTTLLSFAAGRRFPTPSPLAFGETGVKGRIRNVLRWKKPAAWVTVAAVLICTAALIACAADPKDAESSDTTPPTSSAPAEPGSGPSEPVTPWPDSAPAEGTYLSAQCLYLSPYSSQTYTGDSGYRYKIADWTVVITHRASGEVLALSPENWGWQDFPWTEAEWNALFSATPLCNPPDISGYAEKLYQPLGEEYFLLRMDGAKWLVKRTAETGIVWSIYTLKPEETDILWEYEPHLSSRYPAFGFIFDLPEGWRISAYSLNPSLSVAKDGSTVVTGQGQYMEFSSKPGHILCWTPKNVLLDYPLYAEDEIRLYITPPSGEMLEATICIQQKYFTNNVYSAAITGTDLVLTWPQDSWYAVISPFSPADQPEAAEPSVTVYSYGRSITPYFLLSHKTEYVDGQWLSATGRAVNTDLFVELGDRLPTVTLYQDFRIDHTAGLYGPSDFVLYDSQGRKMEESKNYSLTSLNCLEQGYYYLSFRVSANVEYIPSEDRYESTSWTGIVRLMVVDKLAEPLPSDTKPNSVSAQLQLIADSIDTWAVHFDYADDRVGYAVTDLDGNGRLEIITAQQGGTGSYTYSTFYEVNNTFTALEPLLYAFPEGSSQPDIMDEETIALFYGEHSGTHTYIFRDWGKASAYEYWDSVWALTLRNGTISTEALALKQIFYSENGETVRCTDSSGNTITQQEYENIAAAAFPDHTRYNAVIHWLLFPRDVSIRSLDADTLLARLTESCHGSGITEFMN